MRTLKRINVGLRGVMEAGVVAAFGYWGYHARWKWMETGGCSQRPTGFR